MLREGDDQGENREEPRDAAVSNRWIARLSQWAPAFRHSYFRWYLSGHLLSVIGGWMQDASLRWYVQVLTADVGSERWLGLTAAMASLPIVLLSPLGGSVADRWSRRGVIASTQSFDMALSFLLAALVWFNALPLAAVLVFALLHGAFLAFDIPARQAFVIEMVGPRDLMSAIGLNSTIFNTGRLLGPMVAGIIMASASSWALLYASPDAPLDARQTSITGIAVCFLLNGFSFLWLIVILLRRPLPRQNDLPPSHAERRKFDLLGGFRSVRHRPVALGLLGSLALFLLAGGSYTTLLPALADYQLDTDEWGYSLLLSANGFGSVVGALVVASIHSIQSRRLPIVGGLALVALGLIGASVSTTLTPACWALFVTGMGFIMFLASANSTIQLGVPDEVRGRVMSIWLLTFGLGLPVGSLLAGQFASWVGTRTTLACQGFGSIPAILLAAYVLSPARVDPPLGKEGRSDVVR